MNMALAGLVLLVIGDSHMASDGYLISTLHNALLAQGAVVHSYGACGTNAGDWAYGITGNCGIAERHGKKSPQITVRSRVRGWTVKELIERHQPNLVIVQLGDTMAGYGQPSLPSAWIYGQVRALTREIKAQNVACAWVGPPWGSGGAYLKTSARVKEMSKYLAQIVTPCTFVDSTAFVGEREWPTFDGQHLRASGYRAWGAGIADLIARLVARQPATTENTTLMPGSR